MMYHHDSGRWLDDFGMEIPMPGKSHESMGDFSLPEQFRKSHFDRIEWYPENSKNDFDKTFENTVFKRFSYYGPAPFVGDPGVELAIYVWDAWVAADGRWIGGHEAHLQWKNMLY